MKSPFSFSQGTLDKLELWMDHDGEQRGIVQFAVFWDDVCGDIVMEFLALVVEI